MTLQTWPANFPRPSLRELSWEIADNRVVSDMDDGEPVVRVIYDNPTTLYEATFRAPNRMMGAMLSYIRYVLADGSNWLYMPIRTEQGIIDHEVLFRELPRRGTPISNSWTKYTCQILVRDRAAMSEAEAFDAYLYPESLESYVGTLEDAWAEWYTET